VRRFLSTDTALARRARYGDRIAARRLANRHLDRISLLCAVVCAEPRGTPEIAPRAFGLALKQKAPFDDALVIAFGRLVQTWPDAAELRSRLLTLLLEVEQRPVEHVASLLDLSASEVSALRPVARQATLTPVHPGRSCRGWGLASRRTGLTAAERSAGEAHLELCRRCRERLVTLDRARAQLLGGSAGAAGGVMVAAQLVPLAGGNGVGAGLGGLFAGKAGAAVVGSLGAAVLVTGGATAVMSRPPEQQPLPSSVQVGPVDRPSPVHVDRVAPAPSVSPAPAPTSTVLPGLPPVGGLDETPRDLPTTTPTLLPDPGLPALPVPLPTELPPVVPLPTELANLLNGS
jgi:hypothetical protein